MAAQHQPRQLDLGALKARARVLQRERKAFGDARPYSDCLTQIARQAGYACYNSAHAALKSKPSRRPILSIKSFKQWIELNNNRNQIIHLSCHGISNNEIIINIRQPIMVSDLLLFVSEMKQKSPIDLSIFKTVYG